MDIQLAVGFGTSITLLILTIVMMLRFPGDYKAGIDAIGILPSMWMAYKRPQLESQFLEVENPTTNNLRAMGLVEIELADRQLPPISGPTHSGSEAVRTS